MPGPVRRKPPMQVPTSTPVTPPVLEKPPTPSEAVVPTPRPPVSNATQPPAQSFYTPDLLAKRRAEAKVAAAQRETLMEADVERIVAATMTHVEGKIRSAKSDADIKCPEFRFTVTNMNDELFNRCEERLVDRLSEKDDTANWDVTVEETENKSGVKEYKALITCSPGENLMDTVLLPKLEEARANFKRSQLARLADDVAQIISDELVRRARDPIAELFTKAITLGTFTEDQDSDRSSAKYGSVTLSLVGESKTRDVGSVKMNWLCETLRLEVQKRMPGFDVIISSTWRGFEATVSERGSKR